MEMILNDGNIKIDDITEFSSKVRALLIDEEDNILIGNYNGTMLLPGGSIEDGEMFSDAIIRELKEETGMDYDFDNLNYFITVTNYQKDYPVSKEKLKNRMVVTHYFVGKYLGIDKEKRHLSEKEKHFRYRLKLFPMRDIEKILMSNPTKNPRNKFFQRELLQVIDEYKNTNNLTNKR